MTSVGIRRKNIRDNVGSSSNSLLAGLAAPDADGLALDGDLAAEGAGITRVLRDFHLLHLFTEGGTVSGFPTVRIFAQRTESLYFEVR